MDYISVQEMHNTTQTVDKSVDIRKENWEEVGEGLPGHNIHYIRQQQQTPQHSWSADLNITICIMFFKIRGEPNAVVPQFAIQVIIWFLASFSLNFFLSFYWLGSYYVLVTPRSRYRKNRSKHEPEKEIITWTAVHRNCDIWDY